MIVVGLIGKIGSGKSTVAQRLAAHGAHVLDADAIAHAVLDEPAVREAIVARFGADLVGADGRVCRQSLAQRVFGPTPEQAAALTALEQIVHPRVRDRMDRELARLRAAASTTSGQTVAVLDVPLLVQSGWAEACDRLVIVECADAIRRERLAARGVSLEQQEAREAAWARGFQPRLVPSRKTTAVDASGDLAYTLRQVDRFWDDVQTGGSSG